jgi:hypothetical protein
MRRILSISLTWGCLWLLSATLLFLALAILDPHSIDDGEVEGAIFILGPMGILTGFAFAFLILIGSEITKGSDLSLIRAISWGFVGSAIVQVFYLGHGDSGLAANIGMALLFSAFGGLVSSIWLVLARRWAYLHLMDSSRG